jgi:dipeptidyl aminopeptidase/acylaminoacyl peptidase
MKTLTPKRPGNRAHFPAVAPLLLVVLIVSGCGPGGGTASVKNIPGAPSFEDFENIPIALEPVWSPDGKQLFYTASTVARREFRIYRVPAEGGTPQLFLDDPTAGEPAWSADGHRVAFTSKRSGRPQVWLMNADGTGLQQLTRSHAEFTGQASWSPDGKELAFFSIPKPQIWIFSLAERKARLFAEGNHPAWSPKGGQIAFVQHVEGESSRVAIKDLSTGKLNILKSSFTVNPENPAIPIIRWSPDGRRLISEIMTNGSWQAAVINVQTDTIETMSSLDGSILCQAESPDGTHFACSFQDTDLPPAIQVCAANGADRKQITAVSSFVKAQPVTFTSADGLAIPALLYRPKPDTAQLPAIVWLHGGVHGFLGNAFDDQIQYFACHGFVVLGVNYRSSGGFGPELAKVDPSGKKQLDDVVSSVAYLKTVPGVDPKRIAVLGQSGGALLALFAVTHQPDLFAAAVDFYGPTDLATWYKNEPGSRSMLVAVLGGTPVEKPDAYRAASPVTFVKDVRIPILIVHGDADAAVPISQALELASSLKKANKRFDLIRIKGGDHGFRNHRAEALESTYVFLSNALRN